MIKIRVWLAGNHVPPSHRPLWVDRPELECVGESDLSCESLGRIAAAQPDVLALEVDARDRRISWVLKRLARTNPNARIIAHSPTGDKRFVMRLLRHGVRGYVSENNIMPELAKAINVVMRGDVFLCSSASGMLVSEYRKHSRLRKRADPTSRALPRASAKGEK